MGGGFTTIAGSTFNRVAAWLDFQPINLTHLGSFTNVAGYNYAHGINNNTVVVGESYGFFEGFWNLRAYDWASPGPLRDRGSLSPGHNSSCAAINASWQIVGGGEDESGSPRGIRWTQTTGPIALGVINPGGLDSEATALNNDGYIAGVGRNASVVFRALRWDKNVWSGGSSIPTDLGTLVPGGGATYKSYGYGIHAGNRIVGKSVFDGTGVFHAFRTKPGDRIDPNVTGNDQNDLGTIGGVTGPSEGLALNDRDEVVGASTNVINNVGVYHAFLKAPNTGNDAGFTDLGVVGQRSVTGARSQRCVCHQQRGPGRRLLQELGHRRQRPGIHPAEGRVFDDQPEQHHCAGLRMGTPQRGMD